MDYFVAFNRYLAGMLIAAAICSGLVFAQSNEGRTGIVVNGVELSVETVQALRQIYPVEIAPGQYWYDMVSGAWGREGKPIAGQMLAGLELGGPLRADASRGTAGVFVNGRQITLGEKAFLEHLCKTEVVPRALLDPVQWTRWL